MTLLRTHRARLLAAFLGLGLAAIALTGWQGSSIASNALRGDAYDRLAAARETKRRQIENYLRDLRNHVLALSTDESSISALEEFHDALNSLSPAPSAAPLRDFYSRQFAPTVAALLSEQDLLLGWFPSGARQVALQHYFIAANPHAVGSKDLLLRPAGAGRYGTVHARYHPTLHRYQSAFGFYDIFLIDAAGRVVYTVFKEIDLGADLTADPWSSTALASVSRHALALPQPEETAGEDFQPYIASHFAPAAFVAAPIWRAGEKIGVLAIQVSIAEINRVVTGGRNWREEGMGGTGQTYLIGPDLKLRSDLREEIEQPEEFYRSLGQAGVQPALLERIRANGTGILTLEAPPELRPLVAARARGTALGTGFRGKPVLRSYAPVEAANFSWFLVTEIDEAEVQAPVKELHRRILAVAAILIAVLLVASWWIARSISRPLRHLARAARLLGERDFASRVPVQGAAEFADLAESFNRMAGSLERTTVSRDELDQANQQLRAKQAELERLADRLLVAQEEERRRLGRELHDDVTQRVAALAIDTGNLSHAAESPHLRHGLAGLKERLAKLSEDIHRLSRSLHPSSLEDLGLEAAIESECRAFFERGGPPVEFTSRADTSALSMQQRLALYRIAQEALRNVERHAAATEVAISLRREGRALRLEIRDDGRGFEAAGPRQGGVGLASMEERARLAGGEFRVESGPGRGTSLTVVLPIIEEPRT